MNFKDLQALLRKRFHLPKERAVKRTINSFTLAERAVFYFFAAIFISSGFFLLWKVSQAFMVPVPAYGGTLTEGVVGNPRFINPVLALSEADKDLSALVYSGLVKVSPQGEIQNDVAKSVSVSKDLLTYTVSLRDDAKFQDGTLVTADDVVFTIGKIADPLIKSPRRGNWDGVTISKIDAKTVAFSLKKPYAPFIYNLTIGILPKKMWKNVSADEFSFSQLNTLPVGSGPYRITKVERNQGGIPNYYELTASGQGSEAKPYVKTLVFRFYSSESDLIDAYNSGDVESVAGLSPERLADLNRKQDKVVNSPLPRVFAAFFNQSRNKALSDLAVRKALDVASPRETIIKEVFDGYATPITGPLPAGLYPWTAVDAPEDMTASLNQAKKILSDAGWKMSTSTGTLVKKIGNDTISLSFSISTGNAPELTAVAQELKASWEKLGAHVTVLAYETGELNQNVIRPRDFDALLFGEMVGRDADLYPFWHSSQRQDPGLNIALYANSKVDKLLDDARSAANQASVESDYKSLSAEIAKDEPAAFLYTPSFLYLVPNKVHDAKMGSLSSAEDRFTSIASWYVETDNIWKIFLKS